MPFKVTIISSYEITDDEYKEHYEPYLEDYSRLENPPTTPEELIETIDKEQIAEGIEFFSERSNNFEFKVERLQTVPQTETETIY